MTIQKRRSGAIPKVRAYRVELDQPEIVWEKDHIILRQSKAKDETGKFDYEIGITLEEFRQMLRAFTAAD